MEKVTKKEALETIKNGKFEKLSVLKLIGLGIHQTLVMNEKLSVLKLIGLGIYQTLVSEGVSCDDVKTIVDGLPNPGEKIELSAEEIETVLTIVLEIHSKRVKM